ncbi:MAG: ABC transporter substrate-binding protein, partial [Planctomycetota bacterium]
MSGWRLWVAVAVVAVLLWWLHPKAGSERADDVVEVTIWFNGPIEGRQLDVIDAFERRFPQYGGILGSSAVRTGLEGEGNPQRLMCGIAGGVPPEVVEYDRFAICQWAARGAFLDLTPLIEKDLAQLEAERGKLAALESAGVSDAQIAEQHGRVEFLERYLISPEDFYPATWNECRYQGGQFGVPNYMDNRVLYYNSDMLRQAGFLDEQGRPRPPDSWEQILTKRVDANDARIEGDRIHSDSADFLAAGVRSGDTLSHISDRGQVTRCLVASVEGPH